MSPALVSSAPSLSSASSSVLPPLSLFSAVTRDRSRSVYLAVAQSMIQQGAIRPQDEEVRRERREYGREWAMDAQQADRCS